MDRLTDGRFRLDMGKEQMKKTGFRYDREMDCYIYRFPAYKHNGVPLVFCRLLVDRGTQTVRFGVYESNGMLYYPYYEREYGRNEIVSRIEEAILSELHRLGAVEVA